MHVDRSRARRAGKPSEEFCRRSRQPCRDDHNTVSVGKEYALSCAARSVGQKAGGVQHDLAILQFQQLRSFDPPFAVRVTARVVVW